MTPRVGEEGGGGGDPPAFGPVDIALLRFLRAQNAILRTALCTLARRGVALRRREPERALAWIDVLSPHPMFKAGQFLFDLMEWEDFMLDGDPPPLSETQAADLVARLRELLGLPVPPVEASPAPAAVPLPALESGFYLYRDVVLGALDIGVGPAAALATLDRSTDGRP